MNECRQFVKDKENDERTDAMELGKGLNTLLKSHRVKGDKDVAYYKPVLEDDAMLMCINEIQELKKKSEHESQDGTSLNKTAEHVESNTISRLQAKVSFLEENMARAQAFITSLAQDDDSSSDEEEQTAKKTKKKKKKKKGPNNNSYYFNSYSNTTIHETMLCDTVRTAAYEDVIMSNAEPLFRGKTVPDIGCGTDVLSLFYAKAGAKKVIAVNNSNIINQATQIVQLNGFESVVTCVQGKIETLRKTMPC